MTDINDYLRKKSAQLGLERGGQLAVIQGHLDQLYPEQCRAVSLNDGVLKIAVSNASLASELRLRQRQLLARWSKVVSKLVITNS